MTSAQIHFSPGICFPRWCRDRHCRALLCLCLWLTLALIAVGCHGHRPVAAAPLLSPYSDDRVWAVVPLLNESGVSLIDTLAVADVITSEVERIEGITALPVQRVLEAMRALDMGRIDSANQARAVARLIGADGVIVGTITVYDPYRPPSLGMILELYSVQRGPVGLDEIERIRSAASDMSLNNIGPGPNLPARASCVLDAADVGVRLRLRDFARSRTDDQSALNWERYLVVMDLYTRFVADHLVQGLIRQERTRLSASALQVSASSASGP